MGKRDQVVVLEDIPYELFRKVALSRTVHLPTRPESFLLRADLTLLVRYGHHSRKVFSRLTNERSEEADRGVVRATGVHPAISLSRAQLAQGRDDLSPSTSPSEANREYQSDWGVNRDRSENE